jgi:hypothetical protein
MQMEFFLQCIWVIIKRQLSCLFLGREWLYEGMVVMGCLFETAGMGIVDGPFDVEVLLG